MDSLAVHTSKHREEESMAEKVTTDKTKEPGEGEHVLTGERHLGPAEGKEEQSIFENEDERIRGPLLPSEKSDNEERPVFDRDPRHKEGKPLQEVEEVTTESRHKKEE
jgi:hypothetical protein